MAFGIPVTISTGTDPAATRQSSNNLVTLSSDGVAAAIWFDGTNQQFSYASSPYSSWTTTQITAFHRFAASMTIKDVGGNIAALACDNVQGINYYNIAKSGASYSIGSGNFIGSSAASTFNAGGVQELIIDSQGRYWAISNAANNATLQVYFSATPASGSWTANAPSITPTSNAQMPVAALVGHYLVIICQTGSTTYQYSRLDVSQASLGSWSTPTSISGVGGTPGNTDNFCLRGNPNGIGVFAYDSTAGIQAQIYNAGSDTWGSATALTSSGNDIQPTVVSVGSDFYIFFAQYSASNSYALAWTAWRSASTSWDVSTKQLVPAGTNISYPNATYSAAQNTIGVLYTVGTSNPYTISFVTMNTAKPTMQVPPAMQLISPAAAHVLTNDSSVTPASYAVDSTYSHNYRGSYTPAANAASGPLATGGTSQEIYLDLSNWPSAQRQTVLVFMFNDLFNADYRPDLVPVNYYNVPSAWTIYTNAAAGGSSAPGSGWTSRASVSGNAANGYQQIINMAGDNWLRFSVTSITGNTTGANNNNAEFKLEVYDVHNALNFLNDFFIAGDSITAGFSFHSDPTLSAQVNALNGAFWPAIQDGGIPFYTTTTYLVQFAAFLQIFPGQFVFIRLGTNDANNGGSNLTTFQGNLDAMVKMVLAVGKIPIVSTIYWGGTANLLANVPTLNTQLKAVVAANPGCILGDDAYTLFANNQSLISGDNIHPTSTGYVALQALVARFIASLFASAANTSWGFDPLHFTMSF